MFVYQLPQKSGKKWQILQISRVMPEEFSARKRNKLQYRYPAGEGA